MATIEQSIDVNVPVRVVYDQWTQFEEFPRFMDGVKSVRQIDDTHLHWVAEVAGDEKEWEAEITEQHADERVAWQSTSGARNAGVVTFHRLDDDNTRVSLQLDVEPEGAVETAGEALGFLDRRVKGDLKRFKEFVEAHGAPTGAWRGNVESPSSRTALKPPQPDASDNDDEGGGAAPLPVPDRHGVTVAAPRQGGTLMSDREKRDPGAYIGREPEFAAETIPGGIGPEDERVAAGDSRSSGEGAASNRVQGRDDEWPTGHRDGPAADDDAARESGESR